MPSVKNPNGPSKNRLAARAATARKHSAKQLARKKTTQATSSSSSSLPQKQDGNRNRITKADFRRGARAGLLPTSGPNAVLSAKKTRKLERKMGYALKRKMEAEAEADEEGEGDEVVMKDISEETATKAKKQQQKQQQKTTAPEAMAVDRDGIS
ncbi:hypothetical protein F5B17DRAFT_106312 [Nemania serpens]|nr:hypothetical protein F5B17DRAFT_106312 [Nemania serpens]